MISHGPEPAGEAAESARKAISLAKRDFAGFIEGDQPNITSDQFRWLSFRMSHDNDTSALQEMGTGNEEFDGWAWGQNVLLWRQDPSFTAVESIVLGNKREGFRLLAVHLAGKALRRLDQALDSPDMKIVLRALTLWERTMGLLVDKIAVVDRDDLQRLADRLMAPTIIRPYDGPTVVDGEFHVTE